MEYKANQKKLAAQQKPEEDDEFGFDEETKRNLDPSKTSYMKKRTDVNVRHGLLPEMDGVSDSNQSLKKSATANESLFD